MATQMEFEAGKVYVLRGERNGGQVSVWLEEKDSGRPAGDKVAVCLSPDAPVLKLFSTCK